MYVLTFVLLLLLLHMSHNNYIMPSHMQIRMHFLHGFDEHTCTSISALYYACGINWVLQLPITSVVINVVS